MNVVGGIGVDIVKGEVEISRARPGLITNPAKKHGKQSI